MKKCPACKMVYNDDNMSFCSSCGANLIDEVAESVAEQPQQPTPPPPQYNYNNTYTPPCKYCINCGNPCDPNAAICVKCGTPFGKTTYQIPREDDKPSGGLKFLCFLIPILGLILYLVNMNDKPVSAKAYGKMALIGFILSIVLYVIYFACLFLFPLFAFTFDSGVTYYDSEILSLGISKFF